MENKYNHQNEILVDFLMDSFYYVHNNYIPTEHTVITKVPLKFHLKLTEQFTSWMIFAAYPTFVA